VFNTGKVEASALEEQVNLWPKGMEEDETAETMEEKWQEVVGLTMSTVLKPTKQLHTLATVPGC
jgi:hypothetical protein